MLFKILATVAILSSPLQLYNNTVTENDLIQIVKELKYEMDFLIEVCNTDCKDRIAELQSEIYEIEKLLNEKRKSR